MRQGETVQEVSAQGKLAQGGPLLQWCLSKDWEGWGSNSKDIWGEAENTLRWKTQVQKLWWESSLHLRESERTSLVKVNSERKPWYMVVGMKATWGLWSLFLQSWEPEESFELKRNIMPLIFWSEPSCHCVGISIWAEVRLRTWACGGLVCYSSDGGCYCLTQANGAVEEALKRGWSR